MTIAAPTVSPTNAMRSPYVTNRFLFQRAHVLERRMTPYGRMSEVDGEIGDIMIPSDATIPK